LLEILTRRYILYKALGRNVEDQTSERKNVEQGIQKREEYRK
jgi:hypothetical protein